jgi:hypothetical protein
MIKLTMLATLTALLPFAAAAQNNPGEHFIESWDLNADGTVTLEEIAERREMVFTMFDNDENGVLDSAEYIFFDETRAADMENNAGGHGQGGGRMQEGLTLSFNDSDADGLVSQEEFINNSSAWIALIDRDADGVITFSDFGPNSN